ncbi:MAG TPA: tetratricopeptide repeat protein [Gaiellaceae bacterium]|nr:tetratricopeptide repeat protein [Gaiellaceae bacterium]
MTGNLRGSFEPYLPRLVLDWAVQAPDEQWREIEGSLVSVDLTGFTALAERLQARGRAGAEELVIAVSGVFEGLIGITYRRGGDVLKFRGDALLILFAGDAHEERACRAAAEMQWFIEQTAGRMMSSVGEVVLRMSTGIYSGTCHFFLVESSHRELVVVGPAATATIQLEDAAGAGEILVSPATAAAVGPEWLAGERGGAALLAIDPDPDAAAPPLVEDLPPPSPTQLEAYVPTALRAYLRLEAGEAEHRQVTAAFLKFTGIEALLAQGGGAAVNEPLAALGALVGRVTSELGITLLESDIDVDGGKLYLTAGAPSSTGADEERMLRALRTILDARSPLALRAGVNRGPAFAGDVGASTRRAYAVMGDTINLAARLAARADLGEILATAEVLERSRTTFETTPQPFLVKGKERAITAYSVGDVTGVAEEEAQQVLPIVGRDEELQKLGSALESARLRRAQVTELVGEPGMGKSRLVEELKTMAVGFTQFATRCDEYAASIPYYPFRSLLRPLAGITENESAFDAGSRLEPWVEAVMPDFAPWLPLLAIPFDAKVPPTPESEEIEAGFRRKRLHETVEQFLLRVLMMPTLLVVEDAHWMDDASRELLLHLVRSPAPRPWLVAVTRRPQSDAFGEDVEDGHQVLTLSALQGEAATQLALAAAGDLALSEDLLAEVSARSGGNPLFLRELVAASRAGDGGIAALPETVETLITTRIDTLDPGDRFLLRNASVLGERFELDLLADVLADELEDVSDLDRWRRLGEFVNWEGTSTLRFSHDLFRTVAYEGLSFRRRREIHGRVGSVLEQRARDDATELAPLLSLHFLHAENYEKAWRYSVAAGELAQQRFANVDAAESYERALAAADHLDLPATEVARVAEALGDVCELAARYEAAENAYRRARELTSGALQQTRLMLKDGVLRERMGSYPEALDWYHRALETLDGLASIDDGLATRVRIELATAGVKYRQGQFDEGVEWSARAAEHAEQSEDQAALGHAYFLLHLNHMALGHREDAHAHRALSMLEEAGELVLQSNVLNNLGMDAYFAARWEEALELYRRGGGLSDRAGDVVNVARAQNNEGEILSDQGKLEEAEHLFTEALRVWRAAGYPVGIALATSNLGRVAARAGRFDEALGLFEEALAAFRALGSEAFVQETEARRAECLVLAGRFQEALQIVPRCIEAAEESPQLLAFLERLYGYALVQARRTDDARPHFEHSLDLARGLEAEYEVALTLEALARTRLGLPGAGAESKEMLARLGVLATPPVPLP